MGRTGRPSKLTPELTADIIGKILDGWFPTVAARASGVPKTTFLRWMQRGRNKRSPKRFRDFWVQIDKACATARGRLEKRIYKSVPNTALAWLNRGPGREDWGDKSEVNIGFDQNKPLKVKHENPAPVITFAQALVMIEQGGIVMDLAKIKQAEAIEQGEKEVSDKQ